MLWLKEFIKPTRLVIIVSAFLFFISLPFGSYLYNDVFDFSICIFAPTSIGGCYSYTGFPLPMQLKESALIFNIWNIVAPLGNFVFWYIISSIVVKGTKRLKKT